MNISDYKIGVIGLGYVGMPLAVEFGKKYPVTGFDINAGRIGELRNGDDSTLEVTGDELAAARYLSLTTTEDALKICNIYIVTVPTPVDASNSPDMGPLMSACETVGRVISAGDIVIFESTVYPGATEEVCVPVIEKTSGLKFNEGFYAGYSPERVNPGDKTHRVTDICKVTSGSTPEIADKVDQLYASIITAGTHKASSIRVAEAAKVIENTQRDVNIALINELAILFDKLGIDTEEVLEAAGTKWNFLPFRPGLVGGHCIGVDPYYLTYKANQVGYSPEIILAGRRINDAMGAYVARHVLSLMKDNDIRVQGSRILVLGLTFKENCPDVRNTKVIDIIRELDHSGAKVEIYDPWVSPAAAMTEYGVATIEQPEPGKYDAVVIAVGHKEFKELGIKGIRDFARDNSVIYDVKSIFPADAVNARL